MERLEVALGAEWRGLLQLLPEDWEEMARKTKAFERRRHVQSPGDLLRIVLAYSLSGASFRSTSSWAKQSGLAQVSDTDIIKRMKKCEAWLQYLLEQKLKARLEGVEDCGLKVLDSTVIMGPQNWRIHASWSLKEQWTSHFYLSDWNEAESFQHYPIHAGELLLGDRGFARHRNVAFAQEKQARVLVRMHWKSLILQDAQGKRIEPLVLAQKLKHPGDILEVPAWIPASPKEKLPSVAGRLIILRKTPEAAQHSMKKLKDRARRHQNQLQEKTIQSTQLLTLFTTAPEEMLSTQEVVSLYRFRWQVELLFKRLKSLVSLDEMTVHHPSLCRVVLLSKLLGILLVEEMLENMRQDFFCPTPKKDASLAGVSFNRF